MKHSIAHDLGQKKAKQTINAAHKTYAKKYAKYKPKLRWASTNKAELSFVAAGMTVNATADVQPKSIELEVKLPFLLRPFQSKATQVIEREIQDWLRKAKTKKV